MRFKFRDHSVVPRNTLAKLWLSRDTGRTSAVVRRDLGSGRVRREARGGRRPTTVALRFPKKRLRGEHASNAGGSEKCPTTRYGHKYPKPTPGQLDRLKI